MLAVYDLQPCNQQLSGMAQTSESTSGQSGVAACSEMLQELLSLGSDVQLLFGDETVPGHSNILALWSKVIGNALDTGNCSSSSSSSSGAARLLDKNNKPPASASAISIPLDGTSKHDWLTAMAFVYPVVLQPDVTWDNLEVLLAVGSKYDMPALLSKAGKFLQANMKQLDGCPTSLQFAWKWIALADKAGLPDVAQACIAHVVSIVSVAAACKREVLAGMSPATYCYLAELLAATYCYLAELQLLAG